MLSHLNIQFKCATKSIVYPNKSTITVEAVFEHRGCMLHIVTQNLIQISKYHI